MRMGRECRFRETSREGIYIMVILILLFVFDINYDVTEAPNMQN